MPHKPVQPALIIGVGGSGIDIVRRFKRRFAALYPDTPYVRLLGIDTAPQEAESEFLPRLSDDEFIQAANFNMAHYVSPEHLHQHPAIRDWWKGYSGGIGLKVVAQGAGQRRPVGRLALFVEYKQVVDRLHRDLLSIFNDEHFLALPRHYRNAVNVYIVGSTCGGTGTGMFLDLAYLARHMVERTLNVTAWTRALLLMPSAFINTGKVGGAQNHANLRANAFGALTELDFAMSPHGELPGVRYPDGQTVDWGGAPFKSCYLVGNQAANNAVVQDMGEILEKSAVHLLIELASPLTATGAAKMDNTLERIGAGRESQGRPRLYSSFSGGWMELPSSRVILRWAKLYAGRLLERLGAAGSRQDGAAREAVERLQLTQGYGSLRSLAGGKGLAPYQPNVQATLDIFMDVPENGAEPATLIQRAQALQNDADRQIRANGALPTLVAGATAGLTGEVEEYARALLATGSLADVRQFLGLVQAELENWLAQARAHAGARPEEWVTEFAGAVNDNKPGLFGRKRYVQRQQELVIDGAERARRAWTEQLWGRVAEQLQDDLPAIILQVQNLRTRYDQASSMVAAAAAEIVRFREATPAPAAGGDTLSDESLDAAFAERLEAIDIKAREALRALVDGLQLSEPLFTERVWNAAQHAVREVAPEFLKRLSIPADQIGRQMNRLSPLAVFTPEWGALPESAEVEKMWLIGLPESMAEQEAAVRACLEPGSRTDVEIVTHRDDERVVMTAQHHGFPLYALAEIQDCRQAYENSDIPTRPLRFILPSEGARGWGLLPLNASASSQFFSIALAAGWIRRAGQDYRYNPGTQGSVDIVLGSGAEPTAARQEARDEFLRGGYATPVKAAIDQRTAAEGNRPLYEELGRWIATQEELARDPQYPASFREDVEAVRRYRDSIVPF